MKKKIISVALLAVLCLAAVSCQKENVVEPFGSAEQDTSIHSVKYTINGVSYSMVLENDAEWDALIMRLMALAREGYVVNVVNANSVPSALSAKETLTYRTTSEADAREWTKAREGEGYSVQISFDTLTKEYVCVATL